MKELKILSKIAETQPQAAYVAFIVGYRQKFNYIFRTMSNLDELLIPIENEIRYHFIPAICDGRHCSDDERLLLSLPIKMGGLGIINVVDEAKFQFMTSSDMTSQPCDRIVAQSEEEVDVVATKKILSKRKSKRIAQREDLLKELIENFTPLQQKAVEISRYEGASAWLTTLPLKDENYVLNKQEFFDAIHMRCAWEMKRLPSNARVNQILLWSMPFRVILVVLSSRDITT